MNPVSGTVMNPESRVVLAMRGITKDFPGVRALDNVDFDLREGEVHVLIGENGAGKSTLIKVLCGAYRPDAGEILIDGHRVNISDPKRAEALGISVIHQEFNLLPHRDVAQNIFLGREPVRGPMGMIDFGKMYDDSKRILDSINVDIPVRTLVRDLSVAQKQMVELAKALSFNARIFIMDEPTATLTSREIERLFKTIASLVSSGKSVIYISHRMDEIHQIGHRVTVLRDGQYIGTLDVKEASLETLISMMVGRNIGAGEIRRRNVVKRGREALKVSGLTRHGRFYDINLSIHEGEVVGLAGLVGSGRTEVARAIFGIDPYDSGEVFVFGERLPKGSPAHSVERGLGFLPEDRKDLGLALGMSVKDNMVQASLRSVSNFGFIDFRRERDVAQGFVKQLRIATPSIYRLVRFLSGGTQQKVVLSKWLATKARILIFDEPTRGIDVGAKAEIYSLIDELVKQGVAILMISSELPEILGISDRIYVMREGRITGEFHRDAATRERIISYAMGKGREYDAAAGKG
ncbi:MAG TPA: sugar ABC transporter ATP-binding protein [Firmicutes bacterium]|nr:sugar ABC transporter ATP-binding protein [Bacillota bacterium]